MEIDFDDVPFEKEPRPAWLVAKLSKLRDEGRGKLALAIEPACGLDYVCGLCDGYATSGNCMAFVLRERIDPEWGVVCADCAEFLDPALCQAYGKLMATPLGKDLNNQQSPLWFDVPALRPKLAAQGFSFWDEEYREICLAGAVRPGDEKTGE